MVYKVCDAEHNPVEQGFTEGTYDLIIACQVLHATHKLSETVKNLRKLLRPGGYLIIGEGSSDGMVQYGAGFIFGALSGWWAGVDEGRTLSPLINRSKWDALLRDNGFSGIDTMSPPKLFETFGLTLMISQAVDPSMEIVRNPLASAESWAPKEIVLIGGATSETTSAVQELQHIFEGIGSQVHSYKTLEDVDPSKVEKEDAAILSLADLDHPVFKDVTPERFFAFKKLFDGEKSVFWLTHGRLDDEPYCNMSVGFGRAAAHEVDGLRLQYVDIPDVSKLDVQNIAQAFALFTAKQLEAKDILYKVEPEIVVDAQGRDLVPRLGYWKSANDRLNSTRRPIVHEVDAGKAPIELQNDSHGSYVRQLSRYETSDVGKTSASAIRLSISHAVLSAIKTPIGHRFLVIGSDKQGDQYLALTSSVASIVEVPSRVAVRVQSTEIAPQVLLKLAAAQLLAAAVVDPLFPGQKVLVHNASDVVAQAIETQAKSKGVVAIFSTDGTSEESIPSSWIHFPAYLGRSDIAQRVPADLASFVGLSTQHSENETTLLSILPPYCHKESVHTLLSIHAVETGSSLQALGETLNRAAGALPTKTSTPATTASVVGLEALLGGEHPEDSLVIVDLHVVEPVPARVTRYEIKQLFKGDKTYWLCGLSGALGISLCDWMIERGMRNIVFTSRNPKIEPEWVRDHAANGVRIEPMPWSVLPNLITSLPELTWKSLCSLLTPLFG